MITVDLTKNEKQQELFDTVLQEVRIHNETEAKKAEGSLPWDYLREGALRYFFYGGAIRGGKTFGILALLVILASRIYAGSRWHVVRKSYPDLLRSTIPSIEKILKGKRVRWNRSTSNYFVEFENGSRIYFISENLKQDPELTGFLGLETNGFVLEQIDELSKKTLEKARERAGSWYDVQPCIPPPFIFASFNPTFGWLKKEIYDAWIAGELGPPYYYLTALPSDNKLVTADQWAAWRLLDPKSYAQMIEGSWEIDIEGQFLYAFDQKKHLQDGLRVVPGRDLWISFDFNVDPMTAILFQTDQKSYFRVVKEFRIPNSDTYDLCKKIRSWLRERKITNRIQVTGDASGANRISGAREHINHYEIIRTELGVAEQFFNVPGANPFISDSRVFVNSIFARFPEISIDPQECPFLVEDCRFVLIGTNSEGKIQIQKTGKNPYAGIDNSQIGHLFDCLRYGIHVTLAQFIRIPRS